MKNSKMTLTSFKHTFVALSMFVIGITGCPGADSTIASKPPMPYVSATQGAVLSSNAKGSSVPIVIGVKPATGQECDMCINGISNCGGPCGGGGGGDYTDDPGMSSGGSGGDCGAPGQCACSVGNYGLVGFCGSRPPSAVCTYCPPGTTLADPCGTKCTVEEEDKAPQPEGKHCPEDYPVACGSSACCPSSHSVCCSNTAYCGNSRSACDDVDKPTSTSGGSSGGGGGGGGGSCAWACPSGLRKASLRTGCCSVGSCPSSCSDTCGYGWYEANGSLFGPCTVKNTSCMQNAARAALNACR